MAQIQNTTLSGQVAVVTGAGRGIGEAISTRLAALGVTVVLVARAIDQLKKIQRQIEADGGHAVSISCDLLDAGAITSLGRQVRERFGRCDILVNNAGISYQGPLHEMPIEEWDKLMGTNLRAPYLMMKTLVPLMIESGSGHVVNISSLAGKNPLPNGAAYSASKWGLNGLTYSVAEELRAHNIRVSVIVPGSVNTHFGDIASGKDPARKIQPENIAAIVEMLVTQPPNCFVSEVLVRPTRKP